MSPRQQTAGSQPEANAEQRQPSSLNSLTSSPGRATQGNGPPCSFDRNDAVLPFVPYLTLQMVDTAWWQRSTASLEAIPGSTAKAHLRYRIERYSHDVFEVGTIPVPADACTRVVADQECLLEDARWKAGKSSALLHIGFNHAGSGGCCERSAIKIVACAKTVGNALGCPPLNLNGVRSSASICSIRAPSSAADRNRLALREPGIRGSSNRLSIDHATASKRPPLSGRPFHCRPKPATQSGGGINHGRDHARTCCRVRRVTMRHSITSFRLLTMPERWQRRRHIQGASSAY
jgi:hypothetical protein